MHGLKTGNANGGDRMGIDGLTIVEKDRFGKLADISELLAKHNINVESISATTVNRTAVVKMSVSDQPKAFSTLKEAGFNVMEESAVILQLKDEPGQLAKISRMLANAKVNINAVHILDKEGGDKPVSVETSDPKKTRYILHEYVR
jgi:hypothetical protein